MKVYGPYTQKSGRKHVILKYEDGSRRTVSYPKYLMEQAVGKVLDPDLETVDHLNNDHTDNDPSNLRVLDRVSHATEDALRLALVTVECVLCGESFERSPKQLADSARQGKSGPFCGKRCAGRYGALLQSGKLDELARVHYPEEEVQNRHYYRNKSIPS